MKRSIAFYGASIFVAVFFFFGCSDSSVVGERESSLGEETENLTTQTTQDTINSRPKPINSDSSMERTAERKGCYASLNIHDPNDGKTYEVLSSSSDISIDLNVTFFPSCTNPPGAISWHRSASVNGNEIYYSKWFWTEYEDPTNATSFNVNKEINVDGSNINFGKNTLKATSDWDHRDKAWSTVSFYVEQRVTYDFLGPNYIEVGDKEEWTFNIDNIQNVTSDYEWKITDPYGHTETINTSGNSIEWSEKRHDGQFDMKVKVDVTDNSGDHETVSDKRTIVVTEGGGFHSR